ncbi:MAG: tetratricopeptide repeat protein [Sphingomonas sp.]|nr:tetratricopeptide repeat protein [Sphingomonas sp.]
MTIQTATARRLDEATADAIRQALANARAGRLEDACSVAERALAGGADPVAINALLGMLRLDLRDFDRAIQHLELAHRERPFDLKIATNLVTALVAAERFDRALEVASRDLAFADPTQQIARLRGFAADQLSDFAAAAEALEHVVAAAPQDWESWNNLGNARRGTEDWDASVEAHKRSIEINPMAAPSRLNYASALREAGRFDEAEAEFRKMAADFPSDAKPLRELHILLKDLNRDDDAVAAIEQAIEREPTNLEFLLGRASHLSLLHKMDAAEAGYRHVLEIDPLNQAAHLGIALVYELTNRTDDLAAFIRESEQRGVSEDALNLMRACYFQRTKDYAAGLAALAEVPEELEGARRFHTLGQLLDGAGRYDEAFEAFSRMNRLLADDRSMPEERATHYRGIIADAPGVITREWIGKWREEGERDPRPTPVFLVGFPRSGTTLLDTILMSHPRIEVLEEEPALRDAHEFLPDLESLPTATDRQIAKARDRYFETASTLTPLAPGNLLIDKNPLTMNLLPLVRRLFPDARIILALRHPCDVVLSCFMANFRLNDGMANFLRLDTAAELYDLSFSYYEHVQSIMPMPAHTVMYENVVADRETELRKLFDFLGLDWHDAVLDHQKTALERGRIKTASYSQVVEPIYTRASGRWLKYRKHLEPVLPALDPWIRKFGYSAES